jgi:molybdopterin/thiamine biosynthesis adenylyltransferase
MGINERYSRQYLLKHISNQGQKRLADSRVVIVGCGALGTVIADHLVRSGVGYIRLVDRDLVELSNLQRQILFDETDVGKPKAVAAATTLQRINSEITIESVVDDVNHSNVEHIIKKMNVVLDGTDNMLVRFLLNDACVKQKIPWIYGGAVETFGMTMNIIPQTGPCFRCVVPVIPDVGSLPTCDTVGVLNTIPAIIASIQSTEALKILLGKENISKNLLMYDVWQQDFQVVKINKKDDCECCGKHHFEFLNGKNKEAMVSLCGRGAIQITLMNTTAVSFDELGKKLQKLGDVEIHEVVLRFKIPGYELNIFKNGRTIIIGTNNTKIAKSLYAKYVGF